LKALILEDIRMDILNEAMHEDSIERDGWKSLEAQKQDILVNMGFLQEKLDILNNMLKSLENDIKAKGLWHTLEDQVRYLRGQIKETEADILSLEWDLEQL
jgi:hypothetical protein